jgi:glycosyltransferase involved in cell wall biosynthesis
MKVAFVSQPIDTILPPYQSSIGICTYGAACSLAKGCEVVVYGTKHKSLPANFNEQNVHFRFFPLSVLDKITAVSKRTCSALFPLSSPPSSTHWLYRSFGRQVAEDLRSQDCDVIHIQHCSQYAPVIRSLNPNARIVVQLHAELFSQNNLPLVKEWLRHVDLVTTVSDYITAKTRRQFPGLRCQTIYNAINAAEFSRDPSHRKARDRVKRILYAGAISPHKGIHVLLDAFSIVVREYPDVRLDIVGPQGSYPLAENFELRQRDIVESVYPFYANELVSRLKAKMSSAPPGAGTYFACLNERLRPEISGKITFHGFMPHSELIDMYYQADIFAFAPIWDEGFGIPPMEAMAAGVSVVATNSGAIPEIVKNDQTGFVIEKNDPRALASKIVKLLADEELRDKMGQAARVWIHRKFTWDNVTEKMYKSYSSLCGHLPTNCFHHPSYKEIN